MTKGLLDEGFLKNDFVGLFELNEYKIVLNKELFYLNLSKLAKNIFRMIQIQFRDMISFKYNNLMLIFWKKYLQMKNQMFPIFLQISFLTLYCFIQLMKWIALKIKNLPIISLEIDRAIQVFETMISKFQTFRKRDELIQIAELKTQFQNRVVELDAFYKQHHLNESIAIFHMLKIKLQKALFKINQLNNEKSFGQMSFKEDSLSLFPENQIKILEQPLFTYYQSSIKKNSKDDYFDFAKDAPKEQISSFGGKIQKKNTMNDQFRQIKGYQSKNQSNLPGQMSKNKTQKQIISSQKNIGTANKITFNNKDVKKPEKKVNVSYKPAKFTKGPLQKIQQQKKIEKKIPSPQKSSDILQSNFLQCLNSQSQLKFTIKMTKEEYRSLLQMKKKLVEQRRN